MSPDTASSEAKKKVQAIVKTLDGDFNPATKDTIIGKYAARKLVNVPHSLVGQNKWFMFEGPVLENDIIAYRYYADARHRFDIYGKSVNDLVMDTVSWNYHEIMDWGSDILKVGNSLGIGSPAVYAEDKLMTLSDWDSKSIEVTYESADSVCVRTTFVDLVIAGSKVDLVQDWSMKSGSSWSFVDIRVTRGAFPPDARFATGFVKHIEDVHVEQLGQGVAAYNYGKQSFHKQDLGMAVFVPSRYQAVILEDTESHVLVAAALDNNFSYRFLANWSEGNQGVKNETEFSNYVKSELSE